MSRAAAEADSFAPGLAVVAHHTARLAAGQLDSAPANWSKSRFPLCQMLHSELRYQSAVGVLEAQWGSLAEVASHAQLLL